MKVNLVAIAGGSGSGKTWLAQHLLEEFGGEAARLSLDDFYSDLSERSPVDRERTNFDHPSAIDWPLFFHCLASIRRGETTALPHYDFATHTRRPRARTWKPRRLVLVDGLWLLRRAELRRLYSVSVYVNCPAAVRRQRRVERDQRERGRSASSVEAQFQAHVAPMHRRFVAPQVRYADVIVESPPTSPRLAEIRSRCRQLLVPESSP